jgi:hypothetical protein
MTYLTVLVGSLALGGAQAGGGRVFYAGSHEVSDAEAAEIRAAIPTGSDRLVLSDEPMSEDERRAAKQALAPVAVAEDLARNEGEASERSAMERLRREGR